MLAEDGFYAEEERQPRDGPTQKQKVIKKIPEKVMRNAKGLAIFTTMRTGLWVSGAGGSGVLLARLPDGSWSPPSGILLHTAGLGFLVGVDIYDCVIVINSEEALEAFTKIRCTLGSEISVAAGPVGAGGILETELHKRQAPIFTYLKSRGFYAGVQIDGTVIIERTDENERFYGQRIPVKDILAGKVRHPPYEIRMLMETIKAAQGDNDFDESALPEEPPPGDYVVEDDHVFGVPDKEDPDPYGVLALEKEGLSLKEAGTLKRASWEQFNFNPSPTSPVHTIYARSSQDRGTTSQRSSWRASALASEPKTPSSLRTSVEQPRSPSVMTDMGTQTDLPLEPTSPGRSSIRSVVSRPSSRGSGRHSRSPHMQDVPEHEVLDTSPDRKVSPTVQRTNGYTTPPHTPPPTEDRHDHALVHDGDDDEDIHIEEPVVQSVMVHATSPAAVSKARIVNVPKRLPPKLPPRNPNRNGAVASDAVSDSAEKSDDAEAGAVEHDGAEAEGDVTTTGEKLENVDLGADDHAPALVTEIGQGQTSKEHADTDNSRMPGGFE